MDTNQENGVSIQDIADLIEEDETTDEVVEESADEEVTDEDDQPEEVAEDSDEEVEYEGKAYKVPKELKEALMRQADYTRKTQDVADQRKAVEERMQVLQQQEQALAKTFDKRVELKGIQDRLSQFEQIDWQGLADSDPVQATKLNLAYQQLQRQANGIYGELQQVQQASEQLTQQQRQQMLVEAGKDLAQRIPNFDAKAQETLVKYAKEFGVTDDELRLVSEIQPNAKYLHILYEATQWRALQAQKPQAMKKVAEAPKTIKSEAQQSRRPNRAAFDRLKNNGRVEDLAALL